MHYSILRIIITLSERILQTGFCNKIELGHFYLVILLSEYFYPVQWWGVFTSDYRQKARLFFKKEWKNWNKKLHIWKHPTENQKVLQSTIAPTVIVYESFWKKLLKIYTLILLGTFTKEATKKCSLLKSCLYTAQHTARNVPPLPLSFSEYISVTSQHTARHCNKNVLFSVFYAFPEVISSIFR